MRTTILVILTFMLVAAGVSPLAVKSQDIFAVGGTWKVTLTNISSERKDTSVIFTKNSSAPDPQNTSEDQRQLTLEKKGSDGSIKATTKDHFSSLTNEVWYVYVYVWRNNKWKLAYWDSKTAQNPGRNETNNWNID